MKFHIFLRFFALLSWYYLKLVVYNLNSIKVVTLLSLYHNIKGNMATRVLFL